MEDDEQDQKKEDLKNILKMLRQVRSTRVHKLQKEYKRSVKEHEKHIVITNKAKDDYDISVNEGITKKELLQESMFDRTTNAFEISRWLSKEKEIDNEAENMMFIMKDAQKNEDKKKSESLMQKKKYQSAQKKLEKLKMLGEMLDEQ